MADHAYWQRTLKPYLGEDVTLFSLNTRGTSRRFAGRLVDTSDVGGPILDVHGERVRIRGWQRLMRVESSESAVMR